MQPSVEPGSPAQDPVGARVMLTGDAGLDWQPVSPRLRLVRWLVVLVVGLLAASAIVVVGFLIDARLSWLMMPLVIAGAWEAWLVDRQVRWISWLELPEELIIRRGRFFRSLHAIPYGRLQWVDLRSGPLERGFGLGTIVVHTASPVTSGTLPGLALPVAEALRERLADRGESQRAGL
ncbi:MAG: PH domain-containing protein [Nostocoides sp.]